MRGYSEVTSCRPVASLNRAVNYCLFALNQDKKHSIRDYVVENLTFEEIIGALLLARDVCKVESQE
jgi:hypothetical protein